MSGVCHEAQVDRARPVPVGERRDHAVDGTVVGDPSRSMRRENALLVNVVAVFVT